MYRKLATVFVLASSCLATAAFAATPDAVELADRWTLAYNAHNPAQLAELYDENAVLMLHGSLTIRGRQAIREYWVEDFRESNPITTLSVSNVIEGTDMVLVHGNYNVIDRNDGTLLSQGRYAHIWLLDSSGNWKLDRDLWYRPVGSFY